MDKSPVREAIEKRLVEIINPPADTIKKPNNRLWIAILSFNAIYLFIDLITAVAVGFLSYWYYGVLVFFAGILPMLAHEALFANAFASIYQRWVSGIGFAFSIFAALAVGLLVVIINIMYDSTPTGQLLEAVAMGTLFLVAVVHGALFAVYFFIDAGIRTIQNTMSALAKTEQKLDQLKMSEKIVDKTNDVVTKLEQRVKDGDGALLGATMKTISGENPLDTLPNSQGRT